MVLVSQKELRPAERLKKSKSHHLVVRGHEFGIGDLGRVVGRPACQQRSHNSHEAIKRGVRARSRWVTRGSAAHAHVSKAHGRCSVPPPFSIREQNALICAHLRKRERESGAVLATA
jgi:hypothetical protein